MQFENMDDLLTSINGSGGLALLHDRNLVALEKINLSTRDNDNIAVFYGAAHLHDMSAKLLEKGYKQVSTRWLTAWELSK